MGRFRGAVPPILFTFDLINSETMKRYRCSFVILFIFYSPGLFAQKHMQTEILGNTESVKKQNNVLIIKTKEAEARIWVYSPTIMRVNVSKFGGRCRYFFCCHP